MREEQKRVSLWKQGRNKEAPTRLGTQIKTQKGKTAGEDEEGTGERAA